MQNRWVKLISLIVILLLSLDKHVLGWDTLILTESISLSLIALMIACWIWLLRNWKPYKAGTLIVISLLLAFVRDTNAWLMLMQATLIVLAVIFMRSDHAKPNGLYLHKHGLLLISAFFCAWFLLGNISANQGNRWLFPFQNILTERILPNPQARGFFEACGMPVTAELLSMTNGTATSQNRATDWDETPDSFRSWRDEKAESCYVRWLVKNPLTSITHPFSDFGYVLLFPKVNDYFGRKFKSLLPSSFEKIIYPGALTLWLWGAKLLILAVGFWKRAYVRNSVWWLLLGLVAVEYPHYLLIWHGDAADLPRHALVVSLLHQYSLWLVAALTADEWLTKRRIGLEQTQITP